MTLATLFPRVGDVRHGAAVGAWTWRGTVLSKTSDAGKSRGPAPEVFLVSCIKLGVSIWSIQHCLLLSACCAEPTFLQPCSTVQLLRINRDITMAESSGYPWKLFVLVGAAQASR